MENRATVGELLQFVAGLNRTITYLLRTHPHHAPGPHRPHQHHAPGPHHAHEPHPHPHPRGERAVPEHVARAQAALLARRQGGLERNVPGPDFVPSAQDEVTSQWCSKPAVRTVRLRLDGFV